MGQRRGMMTDGGPCLARLSCVVELDTLGFHRRWHIGGRDTVRTALFIDAIKLDFPYHVKSQQVRITSLRVEVYVTVQSPKQNPHPGLNRPDQVEMDWLPKLQWCVCPQMDWRLTCRSVLR